MIVSSEQVASSSDKIKINMDTTKEYKLELFTIYYSLFTLKQKVSFCFI